MTHFIKLIYVLLANEIKKTRLFRCKFLARSRGNPVNYFQKLNTLILIKCVLILCTSTSLFAHKLTLLCPHGNIPFQVELAQTPEECQKGLMFRTDLAENEGMLFLYPQPKPTAMWMKNTLLSLDMIFCDEKGKILAIHENAVPFSLKQIGPVDNTMQVLEVRGGVVQRHNISEKCTLELDR